MSNVGRVVCVVPWYAGSHRAWADGWQRHSRHEVQLVTLPGESWRHRLQLSAVELGRTLSDLCVRDGPPDVVVVSSMTDLAALRGVTGAVLGTTPVVAYRHESQFAIETRSGPQDEMSVHAVEWRSLAAADHIWCNSEFHRKLLVDRLPSWLDDVGSPTDAEFARRLLDDVAIQPVGVDLSEIGLTRRASERSRPLVLFNQRWDRDKAPMRVVGALAAAARAGHDFSVALVGEVPLGGERLHDEARRLLDGRVEHHGHLSRADYLAVLHHSDLVVSDADHEFFGVGAVEAIAAGAQPLFPRRQNYPNLVDHDDAFLHGGHDLVARLIAVLEARPRVRTHLTEHIRRFDWATVAPSYDDAIDELRPPSRRSDRTR